MLHRNRLAQGLPITVIILTALGIIVLVILIYMVQQRTSLFGTGIREASESPCPGEWKPIGTDCDVIYAKFTDQKDHTGDICCRKDSQGLA